MEKRQDPVRAFIPKVFSDWPSMKARDEVLVLVLGNLGNVSVIPAKAMQHSRQLRIELSSGDALNLRFDQGVGYWRVSPRPEPGSKGSWFDFGNSDAMAQAERIASLNLQIEGQFAPTQIFATVRKTKRSTIAYSESSVCASRQDVQTWLLEYGIRLK
jgi:hypothetical protein